MHNAFRLIINYYLRLQKNSHILHFRMSIKIILFLKNVKLLFHTLLFFLSYLIFYLLFFSLSLLFYLLFLLLSYFINLALKLVLFINEIIFMDGWSITFKLKWHQIQNYDISYAYSTVWRQNIMTSTT